MLKVDLRRSFLEKRSRMPAAECAVLSRDISERLFGELDLSSCSSVHTFIRIPKFSEIDTSMIYYRLWSEFPQIATYAPRLNNEIDEMESVLFTRDTELSKNSWGIREPVGPAIEIMKQLDVVLVPLLAFDERGNRVGYGKGYYDRMLKQCRPECIKAGLSYFKPVDEISDVTENDVPLDLCITPGKIYRFA
jgi:5-formyltetrahydrofolate cyclo-ligase